MEVERRKKKEERGGISYGEISKKKEKQDGS